MQVSVNPIAGGPGFTVTLDDINQCPACHHHIEAVVHFAGVFWHRTDMQIVLRCPRPICHQLFIASYVYSGDAKTGHNPSIGSSWRFVGVAPTVYVAKQFPREIQRVSPRFGEIFGQAATAESAGLDQICGPGYRKALEFLIKDFLKSKSGGDAQEHADIEKTQLGPLISKIDNARIRTAATRATWLGNDETHYVRKWESKDLSDLKTLIDLTVYWVSAEILTGDFEASMPAGKKVDEK